MKYQTIVADPPWPYPEGFASSPDRPQKGSRALGKTGGTITRVPLPYASMSLEQIEALPMRGLADGDARIFLWTTNRHLVDGLRLLALWGFTYRQTLVWDKTPNIPAFGGSVAPNAVEFLLCAVVGKPKRLGRWGTNVIRAPRTTRAGHSRKPEVFLDLIEHVSPGPYLELFARRQRLGWDTWGNEALEHVEITVLNCPELVSEE